MDPKLSPVNGEAGLEGNRKNQSETTSPLPHLETDSNLDMKGTTTDHLLAKGENRRRTELDLMDQASKLEELGLENPDSLMLCSPDKFYSVMNFLCMEMLDEKTKLAMNPFMTDAGTFANTTR